jgi:hypothetical protein
MDIFSPDSLALYRWELGIGNWELVMGNWRKLLRLQGVGHLEVRNSYLLGVAYWRDDFTNNVDRFDVL